MDTNYHVRLHFDCASVRVSIAYIGDYDERSASSLFVLYLFVGVAFNKWYRKREGIVELIPNYEFWRDMPGTCSRAQPSLAAVLTDTCLIVMAIGLVKDGFLFTGRKIKEAWGRIRST